MLSMINTTLQTTYTDESTKTNTELSRARYVNESLVKNARSNVTSQTTTAASWNTSIVNDRKSLNDKLNELEALSRRNDATTRLNQEVTILVQNTLVSLKCYLARRLLTNNYPSCYTDWLSMKALRTHYHSFDV